MKLPRIRWSELKQSLARPGFATQSGLFGNEWVRTPDDFEKAVDDVVTDCNVLVKEIATPLPQRRIKKKTVALLDDVSNRICIAADLSDCVRNMHPAAAFVEAADSAMLRFTELVESLNTTPELYRSLKNGLTTESEILDDLDRRTSLLFINDFEQCGVHLPEDERNQFVELSNRIFQLGAEFCSNTESMSPIGNYVRHDSKQEKALTGLIKNRHLLAQLTGFQSFAHRAQHDTILGSYDAAIDFLYKVVKSLREPVKEELEQIRQILIDNKRIKPNEKLSEWAVEEAGQINRHTFHKRYGDLSRCLSLWNLLHGFEHLCGKLYGLRFELVTPQAGEIWPGCVIRLDVYRTEQFLGTIYVDVDNRRSKFRGDCHFTVRCSKLLDDGNYQTPIVVLSLSLAQSQGVIMDAEKFLHSIHLTPQQSENLFHEMGHAMHSMLGATRYQHVAGTRCPTDFAEIPSNLMEFFFSNPLVLTNLCGDSPNFNNEYATAIHSYLNVFSSLSTMQQVHYSLFDLRLHGDEAEAVAVKGIRSTTDLYLSLGAELLPEISRPPDYAYHHKLTHLYTYGAKYYSYVIAKACASQIWLRLFASDPFNAKSGEKWAKVQSYGGERPSKELLTLVLGRQLTADDLAEALRLHCSK